MVKVVNLVVCFLFFSIGFSKLGEPVNLSLRKHFAPTHAYPNFNPIIRSLVKNQTMGGNILPQGIYWTEVSIGSPPQTFQLAVDSGSTDLIVPEKGCVGCHPKVTGNFNPSSSSTIRTISCRNSSYECASCLESSNCQFSATYETCNLTAPTQPCSVYCQLLSDRVGLGNEFTDFSFGVIYRQTKNFQQFFYIDGVCGFIPSGSSSFGGVSAFEKLVRAGKFDNVFAMCLNPSSGGVLTLGGTDPSLRTGDFSYTRRIAGLGFTLVQEDVLVGGKSVGFGQTKGIIVDSGTNVLLQSQEHFKLIYSSFTSQLCPDFPVQGVCESENLFTGKCYEYTFSDLSQFPSLSVVLEGATLSVSGSQYLVTSGNGTYCLGIQNTGPFGLNIIGDVIMQNYYTVFDQNNHRLGWAPVNAATCTKEALRW